MAVRAASLSGGGRELVGLRYKKTADGGIVSLGVFHGQDMSAHVGFEKRFCFRKGRCGGQFSHFCLAMVQRVP